MAYGAIAAVGVGGYGLREYGEQAEGKAGVWFKFVGQAAMEEAVLAAAAKLTLRAAGAHPAGRLVVLGGYLGYSTYQVASHRYARSATEPLRAIAETLAAAMSPVAASIRARTPVDTGRLRRSVATDASFHASRLGDGVYIAARTGWRGAQRRSKVVQRVVEYGSDRGRTAQRVIRDATLAHASRIAAELPPMLGNLVSNYIAESYENKVKDVVFVGQGLGQFAYARRITRVPTFLGRGILNG